MRGGNYGSIAEICRGSRKRNGGYRLGYVRDDLGFRSEWCNTRWEICVRRAKIEKWL